MKRALTVLATGPLVTMQDAGRPGQGAFGIGRSGACDRGSYELANRLVGNRAGAAALEVTSGGLRLQAAAHALVVTTGARCAGAAAHNAPMVLAAGEVLELGVPASGLRTYVAVRGGFAVAPVLGSRSTDMLAGLGPPPLAVGDVLPIGAVTGEPPGVDVAPVPDPEQGPLQVSLLPGPRRDWFTAAAWHTLLSGRYTVTSDSSRVGLRLDGAALERADDRELVSEGVLRGALQVPPSGLPVLFLADAPVTGGYPVIGYVADPDVDRCGQLRPGQGVSFDGSTLSAARVLRGR